MSQAIAARTIAELGAKAQSIVANKTISPSEKLLLMRGLESELAEAKSIQARAGQMIMAGGQLGGNSGLGSFGFGFDGPQLGQAPNLMPSEDQLHGLHEAVLGHKSFRTEIGTKATVDSLIPDQLVPGIVALPHEPTRILDLLPSAGMLAPVIEYIQHQSTTGTAGMTVAGATKPNVVFNVVRLEARARKIAVTTVVNDEDLQDFGAFMQYVSSELQRLVIDQENYQLLLGDGTGENLTGIFATSGILTRAKAIAPEISIDTLALAASDLRTGPAFAPATVYAMHPATWTALRLIKDGMGRYVLGNPAEQDAARLWGVPVVQSTAITAGWALGMDAGQVGSAFIRNGLVIQTDYGQTGFEKNQTAFRCEERIALAVVKPAAAIKIIGL